MFRLLLLTGSALGMSRRNAAREEAIRRANVISGIILAIFGLFMLFAIIPVQIAPGPEGMMSPRLVPTMMMIVVTALAVLLVIANLRVETGRSGPEPGSPVSRSEVIALLKLGAVFALAIVLFLWVSPLAAGTALVVGALVALGERRPLVIVLMPTTLLIALWLLFYKLLGTAIV